MPRPTQTEIRMRLVVETPVPGVAYSLQDKESKPVDPKISKGATLAFDFPIRVAPKEGGKGSKFYGEQVRSEGPERRFVYIAIGQQAGQKESCWSRRMKIDIHTLPAALIAKGRAGKTLEGTVTGTGKDGTPACATVSPAKAWRAV
jgi:hypothetical protein